MANNVDAVQDFLRDLKQTRETVWPHISSSSIDHSENIETLERMKTLEEKLSILTSRVQLLENWKPPIGIPAPYFNYPHQQQQLEEERSKLLRLLLRSESLITNLVLENQNLRTQVDSLRDTSRKVESHPHEQVVSTPSTLPAKPTIVRQASTTMSGSRVTWADELQKTMPLNATLPTYQMQQQLANLRRSNSAPAPPVVVQRPSRTTSVELTSAGSAATSTTKTPVSLSQSQKEDNHEEESSGSESPHTVPYHSSMGRYKVLNSHKVALTTSNEVQTTKKQPEPEESEKVKSSIPTLPVVYPTNYDPHKRRFSVCSESLSPEQFKNVQRKIIPKSEEIKAKIRNTIRVNVLFKYLGEEELNEVVDAMEEVECPINTEVVKQGDYVEQNNMYVVNRGELEVFYGQDPVATLTVGCAFGELALMYGCPRTATVKTKSACSLWVLDRNTFRRILMEESCRRRKLYESVLAKVPIFKSLFPYERTKIADALDTVIFKDKDIIIQQGSTDTDKFYIIESGEVVCTKKGEDGKELESGRLFAGDYFGELALLNNEPRQASVSAVGNVKCLTIGREHFNQVMGPCEDILRRNMGSYKSYEELVAALKNPDIKNDDKNDFTYAGIDLPEKPKEFIQYLLKNEEEYLHILTQTNGYYNAMVEHVDDLGVTIDQIKKIYANSNQIFDIHKNFYKSFQSYVTKQNETPEKSELSSIFSSLISSFSAYEQFISGYFDALENLAKCEKNKHFNDFLEECVKHAGSSLENYLKHIFNRVPQIVAFLEHLVSITESHEEKNILSVVLKKAESYRITLKNLQQAAKK